MTILIALALSVFSRSQGEIERQAEEWIQKLRSDKIEEREEAARRLQELGKGAKEALKKQLQTTDAELSARVQAILQAILADEVPLLHPNAPRMNQQAPKEFKVTFSTSKGDFVVKVIRDWAPKGVDRFYNLAKNGYYDHCRFFRVIKDFVCQFGINGDPNISAKWTDAKIGDDPVKMGNKRGRIIFATAGPDTRTTQLFINLKDNDFLDGNGFAAFGEVVEGMSVVDKLYSGYGEEPEQVKITEKGNKYLEERFNGLDYIKGVKVSD